MQGSMMTTRALSNLWCSCSFASLSSHRGPAPGRGRALCHTVRAIGWDPEGILSAPKGGHIVRRQVAKQVEDDKELAAKVDAERAKARTELEAQRAGRVLPETPQQAVEYFLATDPDEMEYESARCRPSLTPEFFEHLEREITTTRLSSTPDDERLGNLAMLQQYLHEAAQAVDAAAAQVSAPAERLRRLLSSSDKAATLYEMAGNNEVDKGLVDLLEQNIAGARAAGNDDAVRFLEKVAGAAKKFVISV